MITGVSKTIAALDNDDAKDTFTNAFHSDQTLSNQANLFQQDEEETRWYQVLRACEP